MANMKLVYSAWDGNAEAMAAELGERGVTVRQWRNRGSIPPEHWPAIIEKAAARGVMLSVEDFGPSAQILAVAKAIEAQRKAEAA
jgi:DNA-binding transcriptional regulator YdaS (Cro superfamily)